MHPVAMFRDKEGRVVFEYPFILIVDPITNEGAIYPDETAVDDAFLDDELMDDSTPQTVLQLLAARGYRVYYMRSDADLEDELLRYFAIADGQLQDALAAVWLQQDMAFPGAEHVNWEATTTRLYTDGERIVCEGHQVVTLLADGDPRQAELEARVTDFLESYARAVAEDLRVELKHVRPGAASARQQKPGAAGAEI